MNQTPKRHNIFSRSGGREGFTLIELLVVVAIIALLVSILVPSLNKARELAKSALCQSNLRSIGTAFHVYANDHNGTLPLFGDALFSHYEPIHRSQGRGFWIDRLAKDYLGLSISSDLTQCGIQVDDSLSSPFGCSCDERKRTYYYPASVEYPGYFGYLMSYGANMNLLDYRYGNVPGDPWDRGGWTRHARLVEIEASSECILVCDIESNSWARFMSPSWPEYDPDCEETLRHYGGMNIVYVDGHVSWVDTLEHIDLLAYGGNISTRMIFGLNTWPSNWP